MSDITKKCHILQRSYLNGFLNDDGKFFVYKFDEKKIDVGEGVTVKGIGREKYIYIGWDSQEGKWGDQSIEEMFGRDEEAFKDFIVQIRNEVFNFDVDNPTDPNLPIGWKATILKLWNHFHKKILIHKCLNSPKAMRKLCMEKRMDVSALLDIELFKNKEAQNLVKLHLSRFDIVLEMFSQHGIGFKELENLGRSFTRIETDTKMIVGDFPFYFHPNTKGINDLFDPRSECELNIMLTKDLMVSIHCRKGMENICRIIDHPEVKDLINILIEMIVANSSWYIACEDLSELKGIVAKIENGEIKYNQNHRVDVNRMLR